MIAFGYFDLMPTVDDIRRANLLSLISEHGGQRSLADLIGKAPAQISQWVTRAPNESGRPRVIGTASARHIEQTLHLKAGWMDSDHQRGATGARERESGQEAAPVPALTADDVTAKLADILHQVPLALRPAVGKMLDSLSSTPDDPGVRTALQHLLTTASSPRKSRN